MKKKTKYKKDKYYEKNSKHRAENKDAIRQQQKKNTKKTQG